MPQPGSRRFICMLCMYVYDEALGDPDSGIAPGTLWEDIPDDWRCPQCGASKRFFENEALFEQMTPRDENAPKEEGITDHSPRSEDGLRSEEGPLPDGKEPSQG